MASGSGKDGGGEQDKHKLLPIASMGRIMKKALPNNAKVSQEAKETMQKCTAEFISIVTKEAARKCQEELRKTVRGDDLVWAMSHLGFEEYVEPIKGYLEKHKEMERMEKGDAGGVGPSDIIH